MSNITAPGSCKNQMRFFATDFGVVAKNQNAWLHSNIQMDVPIEEWLSTYCKLPQYVDVFMSNGFESTELVKNIRSIDDLQRIVTHRFGHQLTIFPEYMETVFVLYVKI